MIDKIVFKKLGLEGNDPDYKTAYFILVSLLLTITVVSFFTFFNLFIVPLYNIAILDMLSAAVSIFALYALLQKKNIELASTILVSNIFILTLLFINDQKHHDYAIFYSTIFPILAIYLKGSKTGLLCSAAYYISVLAILFSGIDILEPVPFTMVSFINIAFVLLIVIILILYYENSRSKALELLSISNKKLELLSTTDQLTNLYNRRYMDKKIVEEIEYSKRYEVAFSLLLLDIDDFKKINDIHGHYIGDDVLKEVSNILQSNMRETDIVGRWGGEEFLIICPNTKAQSALKIAEKVRTLMSENLFSINKNVTLSIGISEYYNGCTHKDIFKRADHALYKAKNNGKNCSVIYS